VESKSLLPPGTTLEEVVIGFILYETKMKKDVPAQLGRSKK
jgi:hypothetical protein